MISSAQGRAPGSDTKQSGDGNTLQANNGELTIDKERLHQLKGFRAHARVQLGQNIQVPGWVQRGICGCGKVSREDKGQS